MAADTQPSTATETSQPTQQSLEPWSKTELESALAHLERLQDQIDSLRSAIPEVVRPLYIRGDGYKPRTKADVLIDVRKSAVQRAESLRTFAEAWESDDTKRVLERARESESRDANLSRSEEVPKWGWVETAEERERGGAIIGMRMDETS